MNASVFYEWYYLIFLIPGGVAVLLLLLSSFLSLDGGSDADADGDADADVEADADGDGGDAQAGTGLDVLEWIGVGRAPTTLVLGALFLGWGFVGFWAVRLLSAWLKSPTVFAGPSIVIALLGAVLISRATAAVAERGIPKNATAAVDRETLVGQVARVVYPVSANGGRVFYYDQNAVLHDLSCRVRLGEAEIGKGRKVILAGYDPQAGRFWVEPSPFED